VMLIGTGTSDQHNSTVISEQAEPNLAMKAQRVSPLNSSGLDLVRDCGNFPLAPLAPCKIGEFDRRAAATRRSDTKRTH
jgi:hypothetical protein